MQFAIWFLKILIKFYFKNKDFGYENCIENGCQELMDGPSKADQFDDSDSEGGEAPDEFYVSKFYFF